MAKLGRPRRWTDEQLTAAVAISRPVSQVMLRLGLKWGGGQHAIIKRRIRELDLDRAHFTGQAYNRGDVTGILREHNRRRTRGLDEILVKDSDYQCTARLKKRLLAGALLEDRCYACEAAPEWQGKPLVLRLDHINGDNTDHRLENLRLLCPNCDSQLPTFAGRNAKRRALDARGGSVT